MWGHGEHLSLLLAQSKVLFRSLRGDRSRSPAPEESESVSPDASRSGKSSTGPAPVSSLEKPRLIALQTSSSLVSKHDRSTGIAVSAIEKFRFVGISTAWSMSSFLSARGKVVLITRKRRRENGQYETQKTSKKVRGIFDGGSRIVERDGRRLLPRP